MDAHDHFSRAMDLKKKADARNREAYREDCKVALSRALEKRLRTSFIGDLATFEREFGFLWGHGIPYSELTDEELRYRELWEKTRKDILDKGNNQIRNARADLDQFSVEQKQYRYKFIIEGQR